MNGELLTLYFHPSFRIPRLASLFSLPSSLFPLPSSSLAARRRRARFRERFVNDLAKRFDRLRAANGPAVDIEARRAAAQADVSDVLHVELDRLFHGVGRQLLFVFGDVHLAGLKEVL